jgi:hypothetical protein
MKDFIVSMFVIVILVHTIYTGVRYAIDERQNSVISSSSILFKDVLEIKSKCSKEVSDLIREKVSDGKLIYSEYEEIKYMYRKESEKQQMAELLK